MSTLSPVELVWIVLSLFGLLVSGVNLRDSRIDYFLAGRAERARETKLLVAYTAVWLEVGHLVKHLLFLLVGILSATLPQNPGSSSFPQWLTVFIPLLFFGVQAIMIANSVLTKKLREHLLVRVSRQPSEAHHE